MQPFSLNLRGKLIRVERPIVMGIVNVTPDSFYAGSRTSVDDPAALMARVEGLLADGADWLDLGGCSTRPGAPQPSPEEEMTRLAAGMKAIRKVAPEVPVSIDTYRADVARAAIVDFGADMVNDISGGDLDPLMWATVAELKVPYILMHMRGTPQTMTTLTAYGDCGVSADVVTQLSIKIDSLRDLGVADLIVDPGFGFAKTVEQNYELLHDLPEVVAALPDTPMLVGLSRKSMFYKPMNLTPAETLSATTAANTLALMAGAAILRVHDPAPACQVREVVMRTSSFPAQPKIETATLH